MNKNLVGKVYKLANGNKWGEVISQVDLTAEVKVRLSDGAVTTFGYYEVVSWIRDGVLIEVTQ